MKIVAIGHQKGVGKNTFANYCSNILRERARGASIQVLNIANCLKDCTYMLYSGIGLQTWHYYEERPDEKDKPLPNGRTPRDIWLQVGSILTAYDSTIFIRQAISSIKCDFLFLPDLRRKIETEFLGDYNSVHYLRIMRGTPTKYGDIDDELLDYSFTSTIDNCGGLNELYNKAEEFVTEHLYKRPNIPTVDLTAGKTPGLVNRY
jgi:hypothetical protein